MDVFTNRLPIKFGDKGILLQKLGYHSVHASANVQAFEHGGAWYALSSSGLVPEAEIAWLNPVDLPDQVFPYLLDQLAGFLASQGQVQRLEQELRFCDAEGNWIAISVELDIVSRCYWVTVAATAADDGYDEFVQIQGVMARLSGRRLQGSDIALGGYAPVSVHTISLPDLIFSDDGTQYRKSAKDGMIDIGPYSRKTFADKNLRILVIGRKEYQGYLSHLLHDLTNGITTPRQMAKIWGSPWKETFGFKDHQFDTIFMDAYGDPAVRSKIERTIESAHAEGKPFEIIIYEADKTYVKLESYFVQKGIPCHHLVPTELQIKGIERAQHLLDLALMLYAKVGGEPWLLPLPRTMEHELVVGIGSDPGGNNVIGYATIFSSQGNYRLGEAKWNANAAEWIEGLTHFIVNHLLALSRKDGWQTGDKLHIVFHLDECWSQEMIIKLKLQLQHALGFKYDVQIAFLHLTYYHSYRLWDTGAGSGRAQYASSRFRPGQGTAYRIAQYKYLVQLCDPNLRRAEPNMLLVELLKGSDEWDLRYKVDQIFSFAGLSWRSVERATLPATLEYGKLVAGKGKLLMNADFIIPEKLLTIPWYL
jgi:hypothetical protein